MTNRKASFLTGTAAAKYLLPAEDHRLNHSGLWLPSSAVGAHPLAVQSGVVWGPGNPGAVSISPGGVTVNAFHAAIQGTRSAVQGVFELTSDAAEFLPIVAASSTTFRRGRLGVRIHDLANGGTKDEWNIEVLYGAAAATAGAAVLPAVPTDSTWFELRQFAVDNAGAITLTGTTPRTIGRGGILPVEATDAVAGAYVGQYRDHPTRGLERWNGNGWVFPFAKGQVGEALRTTSVSGGAAVLALDATFAAEVGRRYRMTFSAPQFSGVTNDRGSVGLYAGDDLGTVLNFSFINLVPHGIPVSTRSKSFTVGTSGPKGMRVVLARDVGAGNWQSYAAAGSEMVATVDDVGPA